MKTALIAGATGLVGSELIKILVNDPNYEKIIVISRRELKTNSPKLEVIITPFEKLNEVTLPCPIDECFCTLGTTQKKSGKQGLYKVDFEYVAQLANLSAQTAGKFLVVSSQGANPQSPFFYMNTKGKMEEAVKQTGNKIIYILRPSLITGKREEFRFAEKIGSLFYSLFTPLMIGKLRKVRPVSATKIARCLVGLATKDESGIFTVESDVIQNY
jgi:uncharacterized protein YbjT (DUF2867 family)